MKTPKDADGQRTELIMQNIKKEIYCGRMDVPQYNRMYEIIYNTLKKISTKNLLRILKFAREERDEHGPEINIL